MDYLVTRMAVVVERFPVMVAVERFPTLVMTGKFPVVVEITNKEVAKSRISSPPVSSSSISLKSTVDLGATGVGFGGKSSRLAGLFRQKESSKCHHDGRYFKARKRKGELEQKLSLATKERIELEQEYRHRRNNVVKMAKRIKLPDQQISDAEEHEMEKKLKELQDEINVAKSDCQSKISGSNSNATSTTTATTSTAVVNQQPNRRTTTTVVNKHDGGGSNFNSHKTKESNKNQQQRNQPQGNNNKNKMKNKATSRRQNGVISCGKRTDFGYVKDFAQRYSIGKLLGHRQFGYTYVATDKANGDRVAVKKIDKNKVYDSSTFAFWSKSSVDIETRRIRLQSNSYTTYTLLDTVTAATIQVKEMGGRSRPADTVKVTEQSNEKKKGLGDWMNIIKPPNEEKDHWKLSKGESLSRPDSSEIF
ncbi:hypothetical protein L2E82_41148 [Cichorium intybus]|uniref:Uncharacterized protein n=1 Tax=Cichorium intybus TaxID=13427 RepID=A0ACB9AMZ3_CICIN|nr:hypothetical protein L2E82_41148 [Cichorium intybus]